MRVADGEDVGSGGVDFGVDDLEEDQGYVPSASRGASEFNQPE